MRKFFSLILQFFYGLAGILHNAMERSEDKLGVDDDTSTFVLLGVF